MHARAGLLLVAWLAGCSGRPGAAPAAPSSDSAAVNLVLIRAGSGKPLIFADFRDRVVVVHFFSTWSLAAQADVPVLKQVRAAYGDRVQLVGVALDPPESAALIAPFAAAAGIDYPVALADGDLRAGQTAFGLIDTVPTTALIDRRGHVRSAARGPIRAKDLARAVAALL